MMKVKINKVSYDPSSLGEIKNININLKKGDILGIAGKTGCGKTTVLKIISGIIPYLKNVEISSSIEIDGKMQSEDLIKKISFSFQDPEEQFLFNILEKEVFFGLKDTEKKYAKRLIHNFSMENLLKKSVKDLSTGQRKILSLIMALSKNKKIKIFDEPTANLDEENIKKFFTELQKIKKDCIIVISSHDLDTLKKCNKFLIFNENKKEWKTTSKQKDVEEVLKRSFKESIKTNSDIKNNLISISNIDFEFQDGTKALSNFSLEINRGDIIGITGKNGSGKTTLINLILNKYKPTNGNIIFSNKYHIACIMQEPQKQLFTESVLKELIVPDKKDKEKISMAHSILRKFKLENKKDSHPLFLSRGEKQLVLLSAVLLSKPDIILFDEPFTGLDNKSIEMTIKLLKTFYYDYFPIIIITDQNDKLLKRVINKQIIL
jgi:energy-coupling factor transporter ATP-binding protein EcfA2